MVTNKVIFATLSKMRTFQFNSRCRCRANDQDRV